MLPIYRNVKPIEHQLRPKGLGLGADRSVLKDLEPSRHKQSSKPGDEQVKEEELVMGPGGCVLVLSGPHKDMYGKVELIRTVFASTFIADMQSVPTEDPNMPPTESSVQDITQHIHSWGTSTARHIEPVVSEHSY